MKQDPNEYGVWRADGANINFDFAGFRRCRFLGYFEGTYKDVLDLVRKNKNWAVFENEGTLSKISITKVETTKTRKKD